METTFQQVPLWSQVDFVVDKAPARNFRVSLEDIESGTGHLIAGELANYDADGIPFEKGDILFGKLRPYLAKFYHALQPGTAGGDIHVYRPLPHAHPRFIYYVVSSSSFVGHASISTTGVKMPRTDWAALRRFPVPLPPLATQRTIADYLDHETSEIDAMLDKLDGLGRLLEERRKNQILSVLNCDSESTRRTRVGIVSEVIRRGISPSYADTGTPVINQKCIRPGGVVDLTHGKFHNVTEKLVPPELVLRPGDSLICSTGDGTLGRSALWNGEHKSVTFDSHVTIVRPNANLIIPKYLAAILAANESEFIRQSQGSTKQTELSRDTVSETTVLLPPLDEQERIVAHLDETIARIDSMLAKTQQLKDLLAERRSALITAAVTGQIEVH